MPILFIIISISIVLLCAGIFLYITLNNYTPSPSPTPTLTPTITPIPTPSPFPTPTPTLTPTPTPIPRQLINIKGDYFQIKYPSSFVANSLKMGGRYNLQTTTNINQNRTASDITILGSNDGNVWHQLTTISNAVFNNGSLSTFTFMNEMSYSYYRFLCTKMNVMNNGYWETSNLTLFNGTNPYPPVRLTQQVLSGQAYGNGVYLITSNQSLMSQSPYTTLGNLIPNNGSESYITVLIQHYFTSIGIYWGETSTPVYTPITTIAPKSNSKYFGYYWISSNDYQGVNDHCNIAHIDNHWQCYQNGITNISQLIQMDIASLRACRQAGMKAILSLEGIFYSPSGTVVSTYEANFNQYWGGVYGELDAVLAMYLDEPLLSDINGSLNSLNIVRSNINSVNGISINGSIVNIHLFIVLIAGWVDDIDKGISSIPDTIDWIGFDEYCCMNNECVRNLSIDDKVRILRTKYPQKGLMLVGNGCVNITSGIGYGCNDLQTVLNLTDLYIPLINKYNCLGMFVFGYDIGNPNINNVKNIPLLLNQYKALGKYLIA